jgi:hypothetical protein
MTAMVDMEHFDQFPPTSPSVGGRLGQGISAEAIRRPSRRIEDATSGWRRPRWRLMPSRRLAEALCSDCRSRSSSQRLICEVSRRKRKWVMKTGVVYPQTELGGDPGAVKAFAQAAEDLGYDHIVIYTMSSAPFMPAGNRN